ncbi:MAG: hypothetical protein M1830_006820, partial [Pleopsidium flavum]
MTKARREVSKIVPVYGNYKARAPNSIHTTTAPKTLKANVGTSIIAAAPPTNAAGADVAVDAVVGPIGPKPDNIAPPSPGPPAEFVGLRGIVVEPMTRPEGPSDTGVPERVIP